MLDSKYVHIGGTAAFTALTMIACSSTEEVHLPLEPVVFSYVQWNHHLVQWLPEASPYEMVEAMIDDSVEPPVIHFIYTERDATRGSKKQYHYLSSAELADFVCQGEGDRECFHAAIDYEMTVHDELPTFHVALETQAGAVDWTFVSDGEPSAEYRAGLIDNSEFEHDLRGGLIVFYLEESAFSTEQSHVTFGEEVYTVEPWPELSVEPFFTAYRGVYSRGVHHGYFPAYSRAQIRTLARPSSYGEGAEWVTSFRSAGSAEAFEETTVLVERTGDAVTLRRGSTEISALLDGGSIRTTSMTVHHANGSMAVHFQPPLPDPRWKDSVQNESEWNLSLAGNPSMMSGLITLDRDKADLEITFDPQRPPWTLPLALHTRLELRHDGHDREAWTTFPGSH